jgi:hypothetical protein
VVAWPSLQRVSKRKIDKEKERKREEKGKLKGEEPFCVMVETLPSD